MAECFDVVVIGGGPGGYKCAELLAKGGKNVALAEKAAVGGTCLNQGCIPFKFLLHVSKARCEAAKAAGAGYLDAAAGDVLQANVTAGKRQIVAGLNRSVEAMLKRCGVRLFNGDAEVVEAGDGRFAVAVGDVRIECEKLVIATGSEERLFDVPAETSYRVITSKDMLELEELPAEIDIIGAGAIGLEAASYFADAGRTVTVIEGLDHICGHTDLEIATAMKRILSKKGIKVLTGTFVKSFESDRVVYEKNGVASERTTGCVLLAVGRKPHFDDASLGLLGVEYGPRGIVIDGRCKTNVAGVYAVGDVTGKLMLAHTAYQQAKVIADDICGKPVSPIRYELIPRVIYTNPEVLSVGLSEEDCKTAGVDFVSKTLPMTYSGKYFAENGNDGAKAKMLIDANRRVIGFHMIGNAASELALAAEIIIAQGLTIEQVLNLSFPHPTYGEIVCSLAEAF